MARKFIVALIATTASFIAGLDAAPAGAEGSMSVIGSRPTDQCAAVAAAARGSGTATKSQLFLCNQAVIWARFEPIDYASALLNRGVLHLVRADYGAALADINAAIRQGADLSGALNDRGAVESAQHRYQAATEDFTQAIAAGAKHPEVLYFNRALAFEDLGDLKRAYFDYKTAADLDPTWAAPAKELARFTVARRSEAQ